MTTALAAVSCGDSSSTGAGAAGSTTAGAAGSGTAGSAGAAGSGATGAAGSAGASGGSGGSGGSSSSSGGMGGTTTSTPTGMGGEGNTPLCPPETGNPIPKLKLTQVAMGLSLPVLAIGAPGDSSRLYIVQQSGQIRLMKNGALLPEPFLDISALVNVTGERGLLGLAFHPDFQNNGRFFVDYNQTSDQHNTIVEYVRSADPDKAEPSAVKTLYTIDELQHGNHNGGMLAFGPDGYLYIAHGDGGGGGDPDENGQNISSKLGKILRIDVDKFPAPAPGNLQGGNPHIWDYGLRNPWRFSFDRCTGDLYIGDVGQSAWEEIDVEPAATGLFNYGWNTMEGAHCYDPMSGCDMTGLTLPVVEYPHPTGCSVTGGYVYRGSKIPDLVGAYLYGDYCSGRIWSFRWKGGALVAGSEIELSSDLELKLSVSSFGQDEAGELYVADLSGALYRIDPE